MIWVIGAVLNRRFTWFSSVRLKSAAILLLSEAIIAVRIEIHAIKTGHWAYSDFMPILPVVDTGVSPFVQLLVLPMISMKLAVK